MKNFAHLLLLFLWLFALVAPSVATLMDVDNPVIVTNLNEEEQQEQGKKNIDEKQAAVSHTSDFSLLSRLQNSFSYNFYLLRSSDHISTIVLPPPERLI